MSETKEKTERVYLQLYDYETKEFSGLTTYHGLVRIYNSNTWPSRIFWSIVVLSCLSLFMIHSGYLLLGYHAKPTLFQSNLIVPPEGLQFPEVTICNFNWIDWTKVEKSGVSLSLLEYFVQFLDEIDGFSPWNFTENHKEFEKFKLDFFEKNGREFELREYFKSISKTCEETFVSCSFNREHFENCCDLVETEMTEVGVCFRLSNKNKTYIQTFGGDTFGWEILLAENSNKDPPESEILNDLLGFEVMVHEVGKYPKIDTTALGISLDQMLHGSISMKNISQLDKINWGTCSNGWTGEPGKASRDLYTSNHCLNECIREKVSSVCNCEPLSCVARRATNNETVENICSPFELSECMIKFNISHFSSQTCDCPSECHVLEYTVQNSYTNIPSSTKKWARNFTRTDVTAISLYFGKIVYERREQQKQMQTADLLSNIAGSMGLFLGMSTVTLLEIFIYLFKSVWGTVNSARQKQFVDAVAEEEKERQQSILIIQNNDEDEEEGGVSGDGKHGNPIHIHLDRRNSRMIRGGDAFSAPRGSVSIPSHMLSPLSRHTRQSISAGHLGRRASRIGPGSSGVPLIEEPNNFSSSDRQIVKQMRRSSTFSPARKLSMVSQTENSANRNVRKVSMQHTFKSQLL